MFKQNKDLYNRYINERNKFIQEHYGETIDIEEFLRNETIEQKYHRFFIRMYFTGTCSYKINDKYVEVIGLGDFIYDNDEYGYGVDATNSLITSTYFLKGKCPYDHALQDIEEYKNLKYDLETIIEKQYDDDLAIYELGYSLEKYFKDFEIDSNEKAIKKIEEQITSYLNHIGLTIDEL